MVVIENTELSCSIFVETSEGDYRRYGPDTWYKRMGESDEPFFNCEEIEDAYQQYTSRRNFIITNGV